MLVNFFLGNADTEKNKQKTYKKFKQNNVSRLWEVLLSIFVYYWVLLYSVITTELILQAQLLKSFFLHLRQQLQESHTANQDPCTTTRTVYNTVLLSTKIKYYNSFSLTETIYTYYMINLKLVMK